MGVEFRFSPNNETGEDFMDRRVARRNIEHYRKVLANELDEKSRQTLLRLLTVEEVKLAVIEHATEREKPHDETDDSVCDSGLSADAVRTLATLGIHGANLLRCRMLILRIDPDRFTHA